MPKKQRCFHGDTEGAGGCPNPEMREVAMDEDEQKGSRRIPHTSTLGLISIVMYDGVTGQSVSVKLTSWQEQSLLMITMSNMDLEYVGYL
jgi:hypothetical protein